MKGPTGFIDACDLGCWESDEGLDVVYPEVRVIGGPRVGTLGSRKVVGGNKGQSENRM